LVAYGVHIGDTAGLRSNEYVHYKAYVKIEIGWVEIDDAAVRVLRPEEELGIRGSAYFCLYSTVDVIISLGHQNSKAKFSEHAQNAAGVNGPLIATT
jgi:hypothetical protein